MGNEEWKEASWQSLQESKAVTLREMGLFITKSSFALNSAAAVALIPLAAAILRSDRPEARELTGVIASAGTWFIAGALISLFLACIEHFMLMRNWIENEISGPRDIGHSDAIKASWAVFVSAVFSVIPFLAGIAQVLCGMNAL